MPEPGLELRFLAFCTYVGIELPYDYITESPVAKWEYFPQILVDESVTGTESNIPSVVYKSEAFNLSP